MVQCVEVHLYIIFRIADFIAGRQFVKHLNAIQKTGESCHFVPTISLKCYKILMQLLKVLMSLYSGRNAVVYTIFLCVAQWFVREGTHLKMRFFLKKMELRFLKYFADPFSRCQ